MTRALFVSTFAFATLAMLSPALPSAWAQTTGGVFGPVVNEDHQLVQYRIAFDPDSDLFAQRLHYERSLNDDVMWRIVGQARKTDDSDADFDFVQGELFWELTRDPKSVWKTGVRFDARIRDGSRPEAFGINLMGERKYGERWRFRAALLTAVDLGDEARDGVFLQARSHLTYDLGNRRSLGVELFSAFGSTDDFPDLEDQNHRLGPFGTFRLGKHIGVFAGALFGLTDGARDADLRLWLTHSF